MKTLTFLSALLIPLCFGGSANATTMEHIPARIALGSGADLSGFTGFFSNGFVDGSTSHTDTLSFDDGVVQVDFQLTVEAFDSDGSPTALNPITTAVGINGAGDTVEESTRIDAGEKIKVTVDDVNFSVIGAPPVGFVDISSFEALMSTIRLSAFDNGVDTFTYAGIGAGSVVGDDTDQIEFVPDQVLVDGDMFMVTADSGLFRGLFISMSGNYKTAVPEPATLCLFAMGLVGTLCSRRKR